MLGCPGARLYATHGEWIVLRLLLFIQHATDLFHNNLLESSTPCDVLASGKGRIVANPPKFLTPLLQNRLQRGPLRFV